MTGGRAGALLRGFLLPALVALSGCSSGEDEAEAARPVGSEVGNRAPALQGSLATGEPYTLDPDGEPVVMVFYQGAYCGLCRERLARLQEHLPAYRALTAQVVAVTPDPPAAGADLARRLGLQFPIVSVDSATLRRWSVSGAEDAPSRPATFLLDGEGRILYRHLGRNAADRAADATLLTILDRLRRE